MQAMMSTMGNMDPGLMQRQMQMMQNMSPAEMQRMQQEVGRMDPATLASQAEQANKMLSAQQKYVLDVSDLWHEIEQRAGHDCDRGAATSTLGLKCSCCPWSWPDVGRCAEFTCSQQCQQSY